LIWRCFLKRSARLITLISTATMNQFSWWAPAMSTCQCYENLLRTMPTIQQSNTHRSSPHLMSMSQPKRCMQYRNVLSCPPVLYSCTVLSCPVLSCTVLSCPVLSCTVLYCTVYIHTVHIGATRGVVCLLSIGIKLASAIGESQCELSRGAKRRGKLSQDTGPEGPNYSGKS